MRYYTKSGDQGMTSIIGGKRVSKADARISVCGEIDELNAHIGMLASFVARFRHDMTRAEAETLATDLTAIQEHLFHVGEAVSASASACPEAASAVEWLERHIDKLQHDAPEIDTFVLPGGCPQTAEAHVCRTVCRRVERGIVALAHERHVAAEVTQYVNRLSDYFFALALYLNFIEGIAEKKLYIPCK